MTEQQQTTIQNHGLKAENAKPFGRALVFPWYGDTFIVINQHGGSSIYPNAMWEHVKADL